MCSPLLISSLSCHLSSTCHPSLIHPCAAACIGAEWDGASSQRTSCWTRGDVCIFGRGGSHLILDGAVLIFSGFLPYYIYIYKHKLCLSQSPTHEVYVLWKWLYTREMRGSQKRSRNVHNTNIFTCRFFLIYSMWLTLASTYINLLRLQNIELVSLCLQSFCCRL